MLNADLIDSLQHQVALARWPGMPGGDALMQRLVNEQVPEEETDIALLEHDEFAGHFMFYLAAMNDIAALPILPLRLI